MHFGKIGVILGGISEEREVSIRTGKSIARALRLRGHHVIEIGEDTDVEEGILNSGIDIAFIALHGKYGEDGTIQKFLEDRKIPYTGSGPQASSRALDKGIAKSIFLKNNIPTPEYFIIENALQINWDGFSYPVVVKPIDNGSSIGLTIVNDKREFQEGIKEAKRYSRRIIVEKYIQGKEITVGILGSAPLPVIHIAPKAGHYSYKAKYTHGMTDYIVPAKLPAHIYRKIQHIGLKAHKALDCRDFSRVDIRLDDNGDPWVLEINTIPGFTDTSLLPKSAKAIGIEFGQLCEMILEMAWRRHTELQNPNTKLQNNFQILNSKSQTEKRN